MLATTTISPFDVPDGHVFRTQSGRWFKHRYNGNCGNEFGTPETYYEGSRFGPITEVRPDWPFISEHESFMLQRPARIPRNIFHNKILPNSRLIFQTDLGYRQLVELRRAKRLQEERLSRLRWH